MEDGLAVFAILMGASLVVFVLFVMPIWIFMHYKSRARQQLQPVALALAEDAVELTAIVERMEDRVAALEAIMDAEAPGWRSKP